MKLLLLLSSLLVKMNPFIYEVLNDDPSEVDVLDFDVDDVVDDDELVDVDDV